jgi:putative iron-only hydrogenase system regulator
MARIGVVAIIVEGDRVAAIEIQKILSEFADIITGRMGIPDRVHSISAISVMVNGTVERISALTGQLGRLNGVSVKSALTTKEIKD